MDTNTVKVWVPASAGDPSRFGDVLGDDGQGWSLVTDADVERALRAGGFIASDRPEQYLVNS